MRREFTAKGLCLYVICPVTGILACTSRQILCLEVDGQGYIVDRGGTWAED